jgi:hypothetical protein
VAVPGGLTGSAIVTVNPLPAAPTNPISATNCAGLTNPAVSVTPDTSGVTGTVVVDWYADAVGGTALAMNTNSFVSTASSPSNYTYYAEARVLETGCVSTNRTPATLTLMNCSLAISLDLVTTNVTLTWFDNLKLQEAFDITTNSWTTVTNGAPGVTNTWTELATNSAAFFRVRP